MSDEKGFSFKNIKWVFDENAPVNSVYTTKSNYYTVSTGDFKLMSTSWFDDPKPVDDDVEDVVD